MKNKIKVFFTIIFTFVLASYIFAQNKLALEKDTTIENVTQVDSIFSNKNIEPQSFPVMGFFNDTLVLIYNKLGSFTAKDRAIAISERINKLKDDFSFDNTPSPAASACAAHRSTSRWTTSSSIRATPMCSARRARAATARRRRKSSTSTPGVA